VSPTYERLAWIQDHKDESCFIYSELDDERYETRKIEVFENGRIVRASTEHLAVLPIPLPDEVNAYEEFRVAEISGAEFEELWNALDQRG
jgi:hypothetical protein